MWIGIVVVVALHYCSLVECFPVIPRAVGGSASCEFAHCSRTFAFNPAVKRRQTHTNKRIFPCSIRTPIVGSGIVRLFLLLMMLWVLSPQMVRVGLLLPQRRDRRN